MSWHVAKARCRTNNFLFIRKCVHALTRRHAHAIASRARRCEAPPPRPSVRLGTAALIPKRETWRISIHPPISPYGDRRTRSRRPWNAVRKRTACAIQRLCESPRDAICVITHSCTLILRHLHTYLMFVEGTRDAWIEACMYIQTIPYVLLDTRALSARTAVCSQRCTQHAGSCFLELSTLSEPTGDRRQDHVLDHSQSPRRTWVCAPWMAMACSCSSLACAVVAGSALL